MPAREAQEWKVLWAGTEGSSRTGRGQQPVTGTAGGSAEQAEVQRQYYRGQEWKGNP